MQLGESVKALTPNAFYEFFGLIMSDTHKHHFHEGPKYGLTSSFICCNCHTTLLVENQTPGDASHGAHPAHHWHCELNPAKNQYNFKCCECHATMSVIVGVSPVHDALASAKKQFQVVQSRDDSDLDSFINMGQTILLLLTNALEKPESRSREIKLLGSGRFHTMVVTVPGGMEVMKACGFILHPDAFRLPPDFATIEQNMLLSRFILRFETELLAFRQRVRDGLEQFDPQAEEDSYLHAIGTTRDSVAVRSPQLSIDPYGPIGVSQKDTDAVIIFAVTCQLASAPDPSLLATCVTMISQHRSTSVPMQQAAAHVKAHRECWNACNELQVTMDTSDDLIVLQVRSFHENPSVRVSLLKLLMHIASYRKSQELLDLHDELSGTKRPAAPLARQPAAQPIASPAASPSRAVATRQSVAVAGPAASPAELLALVQDFKRISQPLHMDPNPHVRERVPGTPSGLANHRNLCYYNTLVQTFFTLPQLRNLVLQCAPQTITGSQPEKFMAELQVLFAFLVGSERMFVASEPSVNALIRDRAGMGSQQDVHEVQLWMMEFLEKLLCSPQSSPTETAAYRKMFCGTMTEILFPLGSTSSAPRQQTIDFDSGQILLNVQDHQHLHNALDAACNAFVQADGAQYHKVIRYQTLPDVLFFPLQRLKYDQRQHAAIKQHSPFFFPTTLFMDRYLLANAPVAGDIRKQLEEKAKQREAKIAKIARLKNYQGSGHTVDEILQAACEAVTDLALVDDERAEDTLLKLMEATEQSRALMAALEAEVAELDSVMNSAYDVLNSVDYVLHAVLVHEGGQAAQGHYVAFVNDGDDVWLRFNDTDVTRVQYDDMIAASSGADKFGTAYCLVYAKRNSDALTAPAAALPPALRAIVDADNKLFQKEIMGWDASH
eukprot:TRINITY_DN6321_c0_g1_i1.p1 TRINITY_DN6321_c0_g1~~TRINITY_DN6321_c0_g1_i1.p1  ORF type:complete len:893 (-),score=194.87 TRINITY_DN6321_c0_g1_i1:73-2751(-)